MFQVLTLLVTHHAKWLCNLSAGYCFFYCMGYGASLALRAALKGVQNSGGFVRALARLRMASKIALMG
jgi:hypothetical protein